MLRCSEGTLNQGLVHVACALLKTDSKDPNPHLGPATHRYLAYGKETPTKITPKSDLLGQFQARNGSAMHQRFCRREKEEEEDKTHFKLLVYRKVQASTEIRVTCFAF